MFQNTHRTARSALPALPGLRLFQVFRVFPVLLWLIVLTLSACQAPQTLQDPGLTNLRNSRDEGLTCTDSQNCPSEAALLVISGPDGTQKCAGALIAENILATANHCIPLDLRSPHRPLSCSDRIQIHFPAAGPYPEEHLGCAEILSSSDGSNHASMTSDYAFIRLSAPVHRPISEIDRSGFQEGATYYVDRIDPDARDPNALGNLHRIACHAALNTEALPGSFHPLSAVVVLNNCEVTLETMGSPIIGTNGKLRGILRSRFSPELLLKKAGNRKLIDGLIAPAVTASNYSCIRTPIDPADLPLAEGCLNNLEERSEIVSQDLQRNLAKSLIAQVPEGNPWLPHTNNGIKWTLSVFTQDSQEGQALSAAVGRMATPLAATPIATSLLAIPSPRCAPPVPYMVELNMALTTLEADVGVNQAIQLTLDTPVSLGLINAKLAILPTNPPSNQIRKILLFIQSKSGDWTQILRLPVRVCRGS